MADPWIKPGQAADEAFDIGIKAAVLAGLAGLGLLSWAGLLTPRAALVTGVVFVPVYLVLVASVLCKLLGLNPDVTDLRPVHRE
jgi:ABC-type transport system involved in cytochrome bd biosynthesis fused ATPase/permease subunit